MTSNDESARVRGIEMTPTEVERFLEAQGHGTLSLAAAEEPYGVPMSFGYDGDRLFLTALTFGAESRKVSAIETNRRACVTSYAVEDRFAWASVVVEGTLDPVGDDEADYVDDVMADTAWIPSLNPPTDPITDVDRYALAIDRATGRKGPMYEFG